MSELDQVRSLISAGKFTQAGAILDRLLRKAKDNDEIWYLRGVVSLKFRSYEHAHECFLHALSLKKKPEYYKIKGMAHMELFELSDAIDNFEKALVYDKNDVSLYFFIGVCLLLLGDPRFEDYFRTAWKLNKKRTKGLMKNFYDTLLKPDPFTSRKLKKEIERELEKLG